MKAIAVYTLGTLLILFGAIWIVNVLRNPTPGELAHVVAAREVGREERTDFEHRHRGSPRSERVVDIEYEVDARLGDGRVVTVEYTDFSEPLDQATPGLLPGDPIRVEEQGGIYRFRLSGERASLFPGGLFVVVGAAFILGQKFGGRSWEGSSA